MAEYICKLGTPAGQVIERTFSAESEEALRREFDTQDYLVFSIRRKAAAAAMLGLGGVRRKRIAAKEFLVFNQELASLISAGLPIISSLDILIERRKNPAFKAALVDIRDKVKSGTALSDAFASHGEMFPKIYASSLASGERSGEVAGVLKRYIAYTKTMLSLRQKVVSALIYPTILIVFAIGLVILLVTFILPSFQEFFSDLGSELPIITRAVLFLSALITDNMLLLITGAVALTALIISWKRSEPGAVAWDLHKMKIPLIGKIFSKYAISRLCRTLSTLVQGGIPLVIALEISARAVGNRVFEREMLVVARKVREGQPLWESIEKTGLVTDMAVEMIKVGESTGSLEEMLANVATFYDDEIEADLGTIVALMEPAILIFMGLIVVTIVLALYLPLITSYATSRA